MEKSKGKNNRKEQYLVTSIVAVYNGEKSIGQAIESWCRQSVKSKELIIVDNGSDDETCKIVKEYSATYKNISLLENTEMKGAGPSRNIGIQNALGRYISFLDADDVYMDENALEKVCNTLEKTNNNVAVARLVQIYKDYIKEYEILDGIEIIDGKTVTYERIQTDYYFQAYVFKRNYLIENRIEFPHRLRGQDNVFLVNALFCAKHITMVDIMLYGHTVRNRDFTYSERMLTDLFIVFLWEMKFAEKNSLNRLLERSLDHINNEFWNHFYDGLANQWEELYNVMNEVATNKKRDGVIIFPLLFYSLGLGKLNDINYNAFSMVKKIHCMGIDSVSIYGLGSLGVRVVEVLEKIDIIKVKHLIDKKKVGQEINKHKIEGIEILKNSNSDIVCLCITNNEIANQVKEELLSLGICEKNIILV